MHAGAYDKVYRQGRPDTLSDSEYDLIVTERIKSNKVPLSVVNAELGEGWGIPWIVS